MSQGFRCRRAFNLAKELTLGNQNKQTGQKYYLAIKSRHPGYLARMDRGKKKNKKKNR